MGDVVDSETRSRMMSGIRSKNTKPEIIIRRLLHANGFRFRLHSKRLPGKPDIVLPKYIAVIFVHGCFWHKHNCHLFKWPNTRPEFWQTKINRNCENDVSALSALEEKGWRTCVVWECALKSRTVDFAAIADKISDWLISDSPKLEISK